MINTDLRTDCTGCGAPTGSPGTLQTKKMHTGVFCVCGRWNKWLSRDELGLQTRPVSRTGIKPKIRFQVLERDGHRCQSCGRDNKQTELHVDHIIPVKHCIEMGMPKNIINSKQNLQTLCDECNLGKGSNLES